MGSSLNKYYGIFYSIPKKKKLTGFQRKQNYGICHIICLEYSMAYSRVFKLYIYIYIYIFKCVYIYIYI